MTSKDSSPRDPFCPPWLDEQAILAQTEHLILFANQLPIVPGSLLVVSKAHTAIIPEYEWRHEITYLSKLGREFLLSSYQAEAFEWHNYQNGSFPDHAHFHLIPIPKTTPFPEVNSDPIPKNPPPQVKARISRLAFRDCDLFFLPNSIAYREIRTYMAAAMKISIRQDTLQWNRRGLPNDVQETISKYQAWLDSTN